MNRGERVFTNTVALYVRMVVAIVPALLASRFLLGALGVSDYGLFGVVAGVMGFMGFLNSAMANGSQRHLAFELGRGDTQQVARVFSACLGIHLGMAVLLALLGETVGLWFLTHVLNIPELRRSAAGWVYQLTIVTVLANVLLVPFQAILTAHEALVVVSILGIIQSLLGLAVAAALIHLPGDHLIVYAVLGGVVTILVVLAQVLVVLVRYPEARLGLRAMPSRRLVWDIVSFSGWNLFGALASVGRLQGIAFLLNIFFGTAVNAAYQVGSQASQLSQAMLQALGPSIVKSEGAGERDRVLTLGLLANKYAFLLDSLWLVPVYAEMPALLHLWLRNVPPYTTEFCRMVLLLLALEKLSAGFINVVTAIGKIALYQSVMGITFTLILPAGWLAFRMGGAPVSIFIIALFFYLGALLLRVWFVRRLTGLSFSRWVRAVLLPAGAAVLPAVIIAGVLCSAMPPTWLRVCVVTLAASSAAGLGIFFIGMDLGERGRWVALARGFRAKWADRGGIRRLIRPHVT